MECVDELVDTQHSFLRSDCPRVIAQVDFDGGQGSSTLQVTVTPGIMPLFGSCLPAAARVWARMSTGEKTPGLTFRQFEDTPTAWAYQAAVCGQMNTTAALEKPVTDILHKGYIYRTTGIILVELLDLRLAHLWRPGDPFRGGSSINLHIDTQRSCVFLFRRFSSTAA